jgi:hypothetical protein
MVCRQTPDRQRDSQYCSHDYQKILRQYGFKASMSGKGNCYDNAAVETFFKTITLRTLLCKTLPAMDVTQHWVGKVPSLSNARWLKRVLGAAQKRDRSNPSQTVIKLAMPTGLGVLYQLLNKSEGTTHAQPK